MYAAMQFNIISYRLALSTIELYATNDQRKTCST